MTKQDTIATPVAGQGIAAALIKAQASMGKALKQSNNPAFRSKYADLGNVMDACMPSLNENGIAVIQPIGQDDMGMFVATVFVHTSGERLECRVPLLVTKQDMQGFGSAVTYARRYGLMAMAGIAPEDDDGNAAVAAAPKRQEPASDPLDDLITFKAKIDAAVFAMDKQPSLSALKAYWDTLDKATQADAAVIKAKDQRKDALSKPMVDDSIPY
jgi:hypothetical protein